MKDRDFAYASGYMRTLENKMLTPTDYDALLHSYSVEEAVRHLSYRGYGHARLGQELDAQEMLKSETQYIWSEMRGACPKGAPIDLPLLQNDFHNLKTVLKAYFSRVNPMPLMLEPWTMEPESIYLPIIRENHEDLPARIKEPALEAFAILQRDGDGQLAEIVLDTALYALTQEAAAHTEDPLAIEWADLRIAIMNMKVALRGAHMGKSEAFLRQAMLDCRHISADSLAQAAENGVALVLDVIQESGFPSIAEAAGTSFAAFEKCCDNALIALIRPARLKTFGFEPIFGFLLGKEYEIQSVRIILSGIQSRIPSDTIRERLRDTYV